MADKIKHASNTDASSDGEVQASAMRGEDGAWRDGARKNIRQGRLLAAYAATGLLTGVLLGLALKAVQHLSGHEVYRLLLNADYVPVLKEFPLNEAGEFAIHLAISIVLCMILGLIGQRFARRGRLSSSSAAGATAAIGIVIGALLYPTTLLSSGGTPPIDSLPSWFWWLTVHAAYGALSGALLYRSVRPLFDERSRY